MRILIFAMLCFSTVSTIFADTVAIRADEWCPYNCGINDPNLGFGIEAAKQILESSGHKLDYQILNWARAKLETRTGKFQGLIGATKTETPDFIFPSESIGLSQLVLWAKKGSGFIYTGAESLKGKTIGVINDYDYGEMTEVLKTQKKDVATGEDALPTLIKKLEQGRIDLLIESRYVFLNITSKLGKSDLFEDTSKDTIASEEIYIAFSPNYPKAKEMATLISDGLKKMKADGSYQKILAKYGVK